MNGINLLEPDDSVDEFDDLELVGEVGIGSQSVSTAVKRAIIVEKSSSTPTKIIALRYDCSEATVNKVWKDFVASTVDVRRLGDENPEVFKSKIRKKAVNAIENGLDCDKDPYRQAAVGINVMKGIGEFKQDDGKGARVNILINAIPNEWKQRYIGAEVSGDSKKEGESR